MSARSEDTPSFSVVVPLFNKGPHIARAIASIQAQYVVPLEIIIVDDGSTDGGYEYVRDLGLPGLVVEQRGAPGPGGYAARNRGVELAKGDWIAFLDADDEWHPNHLADVTRALAASGDAKKVAMVFSGYEDIFGDGRRRLDPFTARMAGPSRNFDFPDVLQIWLDLKTSPIWTSATVCHRAMLQAAGGFPESRCRRGGDKDTWLRLARMGAAVSTGTVSASYFRDSVNMTTKMNYANSTPCMVHSLRELAATAPAETAHLLGRLQNLEIYNYALATARFSLLERRAWADFIPRLDPMRHLVLRVLSNPLAASMARRLYAYDKRRRA